MAGTPSSPSAASATLASTSGSGSAGSLSGGQRAQLALTLAVAKRPELLLLDEPVASLDPLARREFLRDLMETVTEQQVSVVLSSHLIADIERVCDYLIVLTASRVRLAGETEELLASHHRLSAMAVTLAIFTAVIIAFPIWVRPHLIPPVQTTSTLSLASIANMPGVGAVNGHLSLVPGSAAAPPGAWVISSSQLTTPDGRASSSEPAGPCGAPPSPAAAQACNDYIESLHLRQTVTYQPASRYWAFQWVETAVYLTLALALAGFSFWWINRNRSTELSIRRPRTRQSAPGAPKLSVTPHDPVAPVAN
jgi:hypothetical protein